nr:unnamed protein product [Callosobruchus analis]
MASYNLSLEMNQTPRRVSNSSNSGFTPVKEEFRPIKESFETTIKQAEAIKKLQRNTAPVFFGHNIEGLVEIINFIGKAYIKEYSVKQIVLENIAHTKSKDEVMFFATYWTFQTNVDDMVSLKLETLLTETCHRGVDET